MFWPVFHHYTEFSWVMAALRKYGGLNTTSYICIIKTYIKWSLKVELQYPFYIYISPLTVMTRMSAFISRSVRKLSGCPEVYSYFKTEGRARLLQSMGISQPSTGFEHTSAVQSTQRMTDFTSYHFFFLCCQGMTCVCSLSLLLAWKGISKLL